MLESEEELKSLLVKVQEESEKDGLKLDIQKTKIKASSPNTSWQTHGEIWKQWQILFSRLPKSLQIVTAAMRLKSIWFLGRKVFGRKKLLEIFFGRKALTNLDNVLKSRDITLLISQRSVQSKLWFSQQSCTYVSVGP